MERLVTFREINEINMLREDRRTRFSFVRKDSEEQKGRQLE